MAVLIWQIAALLGCVTDVYTDSGDDLPPTKGPKQIKEMNNIGIFGDADQRGEKWYDYSSDTMTGSYTDSKLTEDSSFSTSLTISQESSSDCSSAETSERRRATKLYRNCVPCPRDMIKNYRNIGIKWICGGYQRARRSFKSECMMRYRNCEDGTMFLKLYDHRCKNDTYHGRHWFYIYKV